MAIMTNRDLEENNVSPKTDKAHEVVECQSKDDELKKEMSNWIKWSTWRRGAGFDIANTIYLNKEEKHYLIKGMEEIAKSQGKRQWTTEEICLLKRIKDYNYHIGNWSDRDVEDSIVITRFCRSWECSACVVNITRVGQTVFINNCEWSISST